MTNETLITFLVGMLDQTELDGMTLGEVKAVIRAATNAFKDNEDETDEDEADLVKRYVL